MPWTPRSWHGIVWREQDGRVWSIHRAFTRDVLAVDGSDFGLEAGALRILGRDERGQGSSDALRSAVVRPWRAQPLVGSEGVCQSRGVPYG